jgi:hypothetical protein
MPIEIKMSIEIAPSQCYNELVSLIYRLWNWPDPPLEVLSKHADSAAGHNLETELPILRYG